MHKRTGTRLRARVVMLAAVLLAALAGEPAVAALDTPTGTVRAAGTCSQRVGVNHYDPTIDFGWTQDFTCGNRGGAALYAEPDDRQRVGTMDTTTSWFVCWVHGRKHAGGNDVWYYTLGDRAEPGREYLHAWGFMPAVDVWTSTDPWPGMPQCWFWHET